MAVRFRIRTSQGQEVSFASHRMFEDFVRAGDLAPDDLVYDGETGEWAPARTHPLVLEIEYEREGGEEQGGAEEPSPPPAAERPSPHPAAEDPSPPPSAGPGGAGEEGGTPAADDGSFGLELAPPTEGLSPEEEKRAFVQKMESERAMDLEYSEDAPSLRDFRMESASVFADMVQPEPPAAPPPPVSPPEAGRPRPREAPRERSATPPDRRSAPPARTPSERPTPRRTPRRAARRVAVALVTIGLLAAGAYFGLDFLAATDGAGPADDVEVVEPEPTPEPVPPPRPQPTIPSTEAAVRERAQERFLSTTQAALAGLDQIPDAWLTGEYFRLPSSHPEVRSVWQAYWSTVRTVRAGDEERYRAAYAAALDAAAVTDEAERQRRLDAAMARMESRLADADAHWGRAETLALAAMQSHDALLEAEGLVLYDPSGSTGRAEGIGAGTSGRDSDAQLLLEQVVDLLERSLVAAGRGPREGANVREWVWGGFLDAVTR